MSAAICGSSDASLVSVRISIAPHLGTGQIMHSTERSPKETFDFRVESNPVGRIAPGVRDALGRTCPGSAAIVALEETDVRVSDEHVMHIEGIKVDAVASGHV